jgi:hypothetical protein
MNPIADKGKVLVYVSATRVRNMAKRFVNFVTDRVLGDSLAGFGVRIEQNKTKPGSVACCRPQNRVGIANV